MVNTAEVAPAAAAGRTKVGMMQEVAMLEKGTDLKQLEVILVKSIIVAEGILAKTTQRQ